MSVYSGVNLNYMMNPPGVPFLEASGVYYRQVQAFVYITGCWTSGWVLPKIGLLLANIICGRIKSINDRTTFKKENNNQKHTNESKKHK